MIQMGSRENVFLLPHKGGYMVYAPLASRVVFTNAECAAQLRSYLETGDEGAVSSDVRSRLGGLNWLSAPNPPVALPVDRHYHPTSVTLFLTNRCNLRCTYCYARAGEFDGRDMPPGLYRAAIDTVMKNAHRGGTQATVGFHGGGEPTLAWETLIGAVDYAKEAAKRFSVNGLRFGLATNGTAPRDRAEVIAKTFSAMTLSFDGPPELQNGQRPFLNGAGSFDQVMSFIDVLRKNGTRFVVRCTVTEKNVMRMAELVDFFVDNTGCKEIHFEPVFFSGRCCQQPSSVPLPEAFSENFLHAMKRARDCSIGLRFSAARLEGVFSSFCGCSQDPFSVTPDGEVTACFEVCNAENPLSETFFFGRFNQVSQKYEIDFDKLTNLRLMTVQNKTLCSRCFAKWNCAGDCPVKVNQPYSSLDVESPRCRMIQTIIRAKLEESVETMYGN